jgi:hypothetical protein
MANFQLGHSTLFPAGARLFANGKSGIEKLVIHSSNRIQLELVGMDRSHTPPVLTANPKKILKLSEPKKSGNKWVITVETTGSGKVSLDATDSSGTVAPALTVFAGVFKNHPDMDIDLIANVFRGNDAAKMYALIRILGNASMRIRERTLTTGENSPAEASPRSLVRRYFILKLTTTISRITSLCNLKWLGKALTRGRSGPSKSVKT